MAPIPWRFRPSASRPSHFSAASGSLSTLDPNKFRCFMTIALHRFLVATILCLAFASTPVIVAPAEGVTDTTRLQPTAEQIRATKAIVGRLTKHHYRRQAVNDDLSSSLFDSYLRRLDPGRLHFTQQDISAMEAERYELDDALRQGSLDFAFRIFHQFQSRRIERLEFSAKRIEEGLEGADLSSDEQLLLDRSTAPWPKNQEAMHDLWHKRLLSDVIDMRLNDKSFEEIEEVLGKRYSNRLHRASQVKPVDIFQIYMNALGAIYDPHTNYYSPRAAENFNINMSLSLEGIGAVLRLEDGYTIVQRLIPAGPAEKGGRLKPADRILAIGQKEEGEMTDVVGWRLDDVVEKIRGPKGTTVYLSVAPGNDPAGSAQTIAIVRDKIKLEEQSAQSEVLEYSRAGLQARIGVISLPTFYSDFKGMQENIPDYRSTTKDVEKALKEFRKQNVDGVVIDLRNNGGGSLPEANTLLGLFIPIGPTVQIRNANSRVNILSDADNKVVYKGPLAVLVNRLSASASEIFAAAIQDHGRGIVIGSRTFGKGTAQILTPLEYGQLKLTQAKFYRISGQSTQHSGVLPDVLFPNLYDPEQVGESTSDEALSRDTIRAAVYRQYDSIAKALPELRAAHQRRIADDTHFAYLRARMERWQQQRDKKFLSLNEDLRRQEKAEADAWYLAQNNLLRAAFGRAPASSLEELRALEEEAERRIDNAPDGVSNSSGIPSASAPPPLAEESDAAAVSTDETVAKSPQEKDALLWETGHILLDYAGSGVHVTADASESPAAPLP